MSALKSLRRPGVLVAMIAAIAASADAQENEMPDLAQALLEAAGETGDLAALKAVEDAVRKVFPDHEDAIAQAAAMEEEALLARTTANEASLAAAAASTVDVADAPAPAQTDPLPPDGPWKLWAWTGTLGAGATVAAGNSENVAAGIVVDLEREIGTYTHHIDGGYDIATSNGARTQKRWYASYQLDAAISDRSYAYGRFSYEEDEFSGFDYRLFAGAGMGRFLFDDARFTWKLEGGPGYRYSPIDDTDEVQSQFAAYAESDMDWTIREGLVFEQNLSATWTSETSTLESYTALTTKLTESLSTSISYNIRYETAPPTGRENTDTLLKANLQYGF